MDGHFQLLPLFNKSLQSEYNAMAAKLFSASRKISACHPSFTPSQLGEAPVDSRGSELRSENREWTDGDWGHV